MSPGRWPAAPSSTGAISPVGQRVRLRQRHRSLHGRGLAGREVVEPAASGSHHPLGEFLAGAVHAGDHGVHLLDLALIGRDGISALVGGLVAGAQARHERLGLAGR